jgi:hypothetical protein
MKTRHGSIACSVIALSAVLLAGLWGCEGTTRQGTLYSVQANRSLETYLPGDIETVRAAALAAVQTDLGFVLDESAVDATQGIITAHTAMDHLVRVKLHKYGEQVTRIEVYVGPRGSEVLSRELLGATEARLTRVSHK